LVRLFDGAFVGISVTGLDGHWDVELCTEGLDVNPGVGRFTSDRLEVTTGPTEILEIQNGAKALGLPRKSELKLGDKLGPEVPEGTSCPDAKTDKDVRNNENFIAVEFGIA
jgi:hypothetical protein